MSAVRPALDAGPARWLLQPDPDWRDLVRYGPPGFETYVRIALVSSAEEDSTALRTALATLVGHTTTPAVGYAAIWEGWTGREAAPEAPRVAVPNRTMLLFTGPVEHLRDSRSSMWHGATGHGGPEPHLVWPEDHAWCVACEVDEEIEFSVGCSFAAARNLARVLPDAVREVPYGEPAPLYRD